MHISNGLTVTLPITAFQTRNRFFRIKLSWLALITSAKEFEILRSPGSGASLLKTGQVYNYCAMRGICLLNRAPTFLPLCPGHSRFHLELGRKCIIRFLRKRKFNKNLENNGEICVKITKFSLSNFRENLVCFIFTKI